MTAGARGGVVGAVVAVIAALFYGAWSVNRPPAGVEVTGEVTPSGGDVAEAAPDAATDSAAEAVAEAEPEAAPAAVAAEPEPVAEAPAPEETAVEDGSADVVTAEEGAAADGATEAGTTEAADAEAADGAEVAPEAAEAAAAEEPAAEAEEGTVADASAAEAAPVLPTPPSFDLVRVEKDGSALVAGAAAPGSTLSLQITGNEIAAVPADGQGNFVAMFNLAPSPAPRVLSLVMTLGDGTEVRSDASVVIAPTVAPVVVAAAETTETAAAETAAPAADTVAPAALLVTDEGAKVLQTAESLPADLVANVTIDAITYTAEGAVQLAGRGTAERSVRLYLDNAQVAEAAIGAAGDWAVTLPDVTPGVYTLRADQLDAAGKVTSRFETPFQRETVEALAAASAVTEAAAEPAAEVAAVAEEPAAADAAGTEMAAETVVAEEPAPAPSSVTVQPGFTLWRIATETLGEGVLYVQVFEANKDQIRDPDLIYPGQVFTIPAAE